MADRHKDWLKQAKRDLAHAERSVEDEDYEWSCFAAQQSAEKALKSLYQKLGAEAWGHSVTKLLTSLPESCGVDDKIVEKGKMLDKHYIPTRYPNGFDEGAPGDYYTKAEAERSVQNARDIVKFCENTLAGLG